MKRKRKGKIKEFLILNLFSKFCVCVEYVYVHVRQEPSLHLDVTEAVDCETPSYSTH